MEIGFQCGKIIFQCVQLLTSSLSFFFTATPTTPTVQNVLINPSLIGPKNILITTNMVSSQNAANESNPLKRKHEDDDDYDNLWGNCPIPPALQWFILSLKGFFFPQVFFVSYSIACQYSVSMQLGIQWERDDWPVEKLRSNSRFQLIFVGFWTLQQWWLPRGVQPSLLLPYFMQKRVPLPAAWWAGCSQYCSVPKNTVFRKWSGIEYNS